MRRRRGGKRDVGSWTDSFFTHVRQVLSYCVDHKKTNAHKRGCFRSTGSVYASYGQCLLTQKKPLFSVFTVSCGIMSACVQRHAQAQTCAQNWNINLKWAAWWSTTWAFGRITHDPTLWWKSRRILHIREGGRKKERNLKTLFNHSIELKGCVWSQWKVGHST